MNAATGKPALIFGAGASSCALDLPHAVEILRPLPVEALAGTRPFVQGLSVIRGEAVPIVSVAALLAGASCAATRFVVVRAGARRVAALAVDAVLGVFELPNALLETLPRCSGGSDGGFGRAPPAGAGRGLGTKDSTAMKGSFERITGSGG